MSRRHSRRKVGTGRFARLPLAVLDHPAVQTLSHAAFRVLVLLAARFNGQNNGALSLTAGQAKAAAGISKNTFYDALRELESRGLIAMTYAPSRVPPRPSMYAVAWLAIDDTGYSIGTRRPSHDYRTWSPKGA